MWPGHQRNQHNKNVWEFLPGFKFCRLLTETISIQTVEALQLNFQNIKRMLKDNWGKFFLLNGKLDRNDFPQKKNWIEPFGKTKALGKPSVPQKPAAKEGAGQSMLSQSPIDQTFKLI